MNTNSFKIFINDRNYTSWDVFDTDKLNKVEFNVNPIENKLFTNDIFSINNNNNNTISLLHSSIRSGPAIPGVLILYKNKTYGRAKKTNKVATGKLLYKCIPDDIRLPPFLVPYEIKNMSFSKVFQNIYVTIQFEEWKDKHPIAKLENVIGPVNVLENFYEYQLYCKSLNTPIKKFQTDTIKSINNKCHEEFIETIIIKYPNIQDRTNQSIWNIITIDPLHCQDYDDGFGIIQLKNGVKQLSIYISNVTIWIDILNLWDSFSKRISTIYLPDKKRPMLPTILSDCLCSLHENVRRVAFVMDIFIKENEIIDIKYCNAIIKVTTNYVYEEATLLGNQNYHIILETVQQISTKYKYITNVRNSHDLVSYLMILMNYHCATELLKHKTGIFRSAITNREFIVPDTLPEDVGKFIKIWNSSSGQYIDGSSIVNTRHELLDVDAYIHITSPIRRMVDLLNMIKLQGALNIIHLSANVNVFYDKWLNELDTINTAMRSIKKIQLDCSLLDLCYNNPEVMEKEYNGYLFDKIYKNDGLYQYVVFLPELKLSSRITLRENRDNFSNQKCKLFIFNDEEKFKKKIRIHFL
jgi:exoribonuclease R